MRGVKTFPIFIGVFLAYLFTACAKNAGATDLRDEIIAMRKEQTEFRAQVGGIFDQIDARLKNHSAQIEQLQRLVELNATDPRQAQTREQLAVIAETLEQTRTQLQTLRSEVEAKAQSSTPEPAKKSP